MKIEVIVVSPFQQNCRILSCKKTGEAILVDPGDEPNMIMARAKKAGVTIKYILATHGHIDHIGAVAQLQQEHSLPFYIHEGDLSLVEALPKQMMMLLGRTDCQVPKVDKYIQDEEIFEWGEDCKLKALHTPGHSPGGVSFLSGKDIFCGDLVFAGSIGRTDLPGGSLKILQQSLREKILTLDKDTRIHSGHGPTTTVEAEWANLHYWLAM